MSNTHFGTGIPSDFNVTVFGGHPKPAAFTGQDGAGTRVTVDRNANYRVAVTGGPEGYTEARSAGCEGMADDPSRSCVIAESDLDITCDDTLWAALYSRDRLRVRDACRIATGVVTRTSLEHDGDLVIHIAPDPPYTQLLLPGNKEIDDRLVVEVPCQGPIDQKDALGTCDRFNIPVMPIPVAGTRIVAAARYVEDRNHFGWAELHGARVLVLPR